MRPGEVYRWNDETPAGHHRYVVVSEEAANRGDHVVVVALTSYKGRDLFPWHRLIEPRGRPGLARQQVALAETIQSVPKNPRMDPTPLALLDDDEMEEIRNAIGDLIGTTCL